MANNRMYLICKRCNADVGRAREADPTDITKRSFFTIAKWFPGAPYYTAKPETIGETLNAWLEYHDHGQASEFPVRFEYEDEQVEQQVRRLKLVGYEEIKP